MDKQQLKQAIERIEQGIADQEDIALYNRFCQAKQEMNIPIADDLLDSKKAMMFSRINRRITVQQRRHLYFTLGRVAAILAVVFLLGMWIWNSTRADKEALLVEKGIVDDIEPGKSAGILVLADGRKIDLQSVDNSLLSREYGTFISKTSDSILQYEDHTEQISHAGSNRNMLITDRGQQYQLRLPDGTRVWLNAVSKLTFPSTFRGQKERQVELDGEAYFEVAKDAEKPFIVQARGQKIQVYGTRFNVNSYADEEDTKTTLVEGSVGINGNLMLKPGEQARTAKNGTTQVLQANTVAAVAWREGYFEFEEENIYQVMRKLSRWYNVDVVYTDRLPTDVMQGTISKFENISKVLSVIERTDLVRFDIKDRKIIVSKHN